MIRSWNLKFWLRFARGTNLDQSAMIQEFVGHTKLLDLGLVWSEFSLCCAAVVLLGVSADEVTEWLTLDMESDRLELTHNHSVQIHQALWLPFDAGLGQEVVVLDPVGAAVGLSEPWMVLGLSHRHPSVWVGVQQFSDQVLDLVRHWLHLIVESEIAGDGFLVALCLIA